MSVRVSNGVATLSAPSLVEDAEPLWRFLCAERAAGRRATVDLDGAGLPHGAVMQLLLLFRPRILGGGGHPFVARWLLPTLQDDNGNTSKDSPA